jgi:hypothetical protein
VGLATAGAAAREIQPARRVFPRSPSTSARSAARDHGAWGSPRTRDQASSLVATAPDLP